MPKNEGSKGRIQEHLSGAAVLSGPEDITPTYADLGIKSEDASRWQRAAEHSEAITEKVAEVKAKGKIQGHLSGSTKTEGPVDAPPTYAELGIRLSG